MENIYYKIVKVQSPTRKIETYGSVVYRKDKKERDNLHVCTFVKWLYEPLLLKPYVFRTVIFRPYMLIYVYYTPRKKVLYVKIVNFKT